MAMIEREGVHEMLQAQAHIWNHLFNFINSMSLKCAVQLGIPDIIHNHGQPMSLSNLAAALEMAPAKTTCLGRLMRLLVHSGFFAVDGEGYVVTPSSRLLLKDTATSVSPFLLMMLDPVLVTPWHFLSTWFAEKEKDHTAFEIANGATFIEHISQSPQHINFFNVAMASDDRLAMSIVVKDCGSVFQGLGSLVDVGGRTGTAAAAIADAFPHVKCTVLDLPHVVASVPEPKNVEMVGGNMFESIPAADAVLLKWILHDWTDEECVKILRKCKEAIPLEGGKVIILDIVVNGNKNDFKSTETQLCFDLLMLVLACGKERDENEWRNIFKDAGFSHCNFSPVLGMRSLIEVYP